MTPRRKVLPSLLSALHLRQTRPLLLGSIVGELLFLAQPAIAQTAPPAPATPAVIKPAAPARTEDKAAPPPPPVQDTGVEVSVTVSAERPANRIDRQVYDVKSDVSSTNASAADALNKVPSVGVDPDGTVTLRGSTNVQILVDGKPSAMMQGENRGQALQSMPADDIESVEVINNPGAQFGNEAGGGPILNLVTRRVRRPGGFGAINANGGTAGRYNSSLFGTYNTGRIGVQGNVNYRHDGRNSVGAATRERIDPVTGAAVRSTQASRSTGLNDAAGFNSNFTYNLGDKDTLGANVSYNRRTDNQAGEDRYVSLGGDDIADSDYLRTTRRIGTSENYAWGVRMDHKGGIPGELMKLDLRVSSSANDSSSAYANQYAIRPPTARDSQSRQGNDTSIKIIDFTGDYERPGDTGMLKLGYKLARNTSDFDTRFVDIDLATQQQMVNLLRTNRFGLQETTLAAYGSYQLRLNEYWGVLAGLRAEHTSIDLDQLTSHIEATNRYTNYIPSFFVSYKASEDTNIRFSYAHRIRRPNANDLNPFVMYRDELNVSSGNPSLKPTQTDSFELGYETRFGGMETNLRGYYRRDSDLIAVRRYFISDTVLLTTRDNAGSNRAGGLEFTLSGKLLPKLTLNASGNLAYNEQTIFGATTDRSTKLGATSLTGRARFGYQLSDADHLQLNLNAQGKSLVGQGYRQPASTADFSFRHNLSPALSLVLNVSDIFNSNKIETVTDSEVLHETNIRRFDGRVAYLGLSYRLGGVSGPGTGRRGGPGGGGNGGGGGGFRGQ